MTETNLQNELSELEPLKLKARTIRKGKQSEVEKKKTSMDDSMNE